MKNWMAELSLHYDRLKRRYPHDRLLILFDIDGTILDMRYMVWQLLKTYDFLHQSNHFRQLEIGDIRVSENDSTAQRHL